MSDWKLSSRSLEISGTTGGTGSCEIPKYNSVAMCLIIQHVAAGGTAFDNFSAIAKEMYPKDGSGNVPGFVNLPSDSLAKLGLLFNRTRSAEVAADASDADLSAGVTVNSYYIFWIQHDWRQYKKPQMYFNLAPDEVTTGITSYSCTIHIAVLPGDSGKNEVWNYYEHDSAKNHEVNWEDGVMIEEAFIEFENTTTIQNIQLPGADGVLDIDVQNDTDAIPPSISYVARINGTSYDADNVHFTDLMNMPHDDRALTAKLAAAKTATYWGVGVYSISVSDTREAGERSRGHGDSEVQPIAESGFKPVSFEAWIPPSSGMIRNVMPGIKRREMG